MCNLPQSRLTEKYQNNETVDTTSHDPKNQERSSKHNRLDTDDQNKLESEMTRPLSPPKKPNDALPYIPFSSTFGKSEKLIERKAEKFRLSLDSQTQLKRHVSDSGQHLRRRARSSEGYVLRKNRIEFFEEASYFMGKRNEGKSACSSLSASIRTNEVVRSNTHDRTYHDKKEHSEEHFYDKRPDARHRSVIPVEHPFKIIWDVSTVVLSLAHSYLTHMAIRDRRFEASPFISFCQAWFLVDIMLNFFTERKTSTGEIISDHRRIVARYLTSWFAVDILSLMPWEVLYVQPLIDVQNRRGFFKKSFFRSKAVVRVTTHLRGRHFRWFGTVAKHTKHHGIGAQRLLRLIIKYVPKYLMFLRNMKGVVAMRILRFVHWLRRSFKNIESKTLDVSVKSKKSLRDNHENIRISPSVERSADKWQSPSFDVSYKWGKPDDDGVPL